MGIFLLTMADQLQFFVRGSFSLIFVIISILIGLRLISKYFQYGQKNFISVGLTWIFLSSSWWWSGFNFIANLFNYSLSETSYLILSNGFIAPALVSWLYSFTTLAYEQWKQKILILSLGIAIPYEFILLILIFAQPTLIGWEVSENVISRTPLTLSVAIIAIVIALITGLIFSKNAMKSQDKEIKWKGRFLLLAFVLFTIGAGLDSVSWTSFFMIILIRLILIMSSIIYYIAFFLPDRVKKVLIKEEL
ncbi:MAG: conserved membrane protein of unknown function [Promethearchaeota archaeon]|jgi:hypothetical protein|nr:MAG: conserved membrane protein of unknown function [Candidatus Lokiarchaeota archaeon]